MSIPPIQSSHTQCDNRTWSIICSAVFLRYCCGPPDVYFPTEQMDEGLAGRQRQYEGWIHNLSKELNHYKAANLELSNRFRELCGNASQPMEQGKGTVWLILDRDILLSFFYKAP